MDPQADQEMNTGTDENAAAPAADTPAEGGMSDMGEGVEVETPAAPAEESSEGGEGAEETPAA